MHALVLIRSIFKACKSDGILLSVIAGNLTSPLRMSVPTKDALLYIGFVPYSRKGSTYTYLFIEYSVMYE